MLKYPFGKKQSPEPGKIKTVAEGIYWLRMSLPYVLNHINLWLLEDDDGWTVVDTGINNRETRETWERVIVEHLESKPVKRVIVTHLHPDHLGLGGWLTDRFSCDLWISQLEFQLCQSLVKDTAKPVTDAAIDFYRAAGYDEFQLATYKRWFGTFGKKMSNLPESYHRMKDDDRLTINGREWKVVVGSGHSPEHVCLFCPELKILISGDQVLPRITSNVSLLANAPDANPLADWLNSCSRIKELLPDDILVLPSHQEPFYGLHHRLLALIKSHETVLDRLLSFLESPNTAIGCIPTMFGREISSNELQFAMGETLAHLNYLLKLNQIRCDKAGDGLDYYVQIKSIF